MKYSFDQLPPRRDTDSIKWRAYDQDVLPMWVADMDFLSPEPVIRALRERVEHGVFGYPDCLLPGCRGVTGLRQIVVERMAERYQWQVRPEDLVFIPGVVTGLNLACHAMAVPGGSVLVQTPVYPPILEAPLNAGLARREMELTLCPDGSYIIDREAFEAALDESTSLFLLCNPHNPVGRVFQRAELEWMAETCFRKGVVICSDEIHGDLVFQGHRHTPLASLDPEIAGNMITLIAPSKTYNLAGLQCSIAIIPNPELRQKFQAAGEGLVPWVNAMGLTAALAAYREGQDWLDQLLVYLEANRDYVWEFLSKQAPSLRMAKPEGTYLAWIDCREAGIPGNPSQFFLKTGRVALNDGTTFGRSGEGFVRLNFGCPRPILEEALQRIKSALDSLP